MPRKKISEELRQQVQEQARNYCEYCRYPGRMADQGQLTVDHIKPIQLGGENELENLACCCTGCNQRESKKTRGIDPLISCTKLKCFYFGCFSQITFNLKSPLDKASQM